MSEARVECDGLVAEFCEEAMDLLQELPENLAEFARDNQNAEAINLVFRSVHTIKGNAGFFGFNVVKSFAHSLEDVFDELRQGKAVLSDDLTRNLVKGLDVLGAMIAEINNGAQDATMEQRYTELLHSINDLSATSGNDAAELRLLADIHALANEIATAQVAQSDEWARRLRDLAMPDKCGEADEQTDAEQDGQPTPEQLAQSRFECAGENITEHVQSLLEVFLAVDNNSYQTEHGSAFDRAMKAFIEWTEQRSLVSLTSSLQVARDDFATIFNSPLDMDAYLLAAVWRRLGPSLAALRAKEVASVASPTPPSQPNEDSASHPPAEPIAKARFLRVREEYVDNFLDDVCNLFITCERLKDLQLRMIGELNSNTLVDELRQINAALGAQSTALQRSVVELRKVPVRNLFSKFPRVARSLASQLGKQLDVHLEGEEIEIDKSLVEDLDGPLMHMIRNVCDHGLETPSERQQRGDSATGNLWLSCTLTKSHVHISVRDDGRGIDPTRLRRKAVERGIFSAEEAAALSEQQAVELIFHPGFSTAERISEVSGRGVGLDVVRTRLQDHNGDVKVISVVGEGTTFHLEIPIRRAVIVVEGLLVRHADATFVIPFEHIQEIVRLFPEEVTSVRGKPVANVRGEPYGVTSLSAYVGSASSHAPQDGPCDAVLISANKRAVLLQVDAVQGQRKVVVSDIASVLPNCERVNGIAQLGGGRLALVLNATELLQTSDQ